MKGEGQSMCLNSQRNPATETINLAGGEAFAETSKLEIFSMLLTCTLKNEFYLSVDAPVDRTKKLVMPIPYNQFSAKAALHARNQAGVWAESEDEAEGHKAEAWEQLIKSRKLGYFALLRNLRNILTSVPRLINEVVEMLTDERLIRRSLVLPFHFRLAVEALERDPPYGALRVMAALSDAVDISLANLPKFNGRTLPDRLAGQGAGGDEAP